MTTVRTLPTAIIGFHLEHWEKKWIDDLTVATEVARSVWRACDARTERAQEWCIPGEQLSWDHNLWFEGSWFPVDPLEGYGERDVWLALTVPAAFLSRRQLADVYEAARNVARVKAAGPLDEWPDQNDPFAVAAQLYSALEDMED